MIPRMQESQPPNRGACADDTQMSSTWEEEYFDGEEVYFIALCIIFLMLGR